jgi:hypothetical protein
MAEAIQQSDNLPAAESLSDRARRLIEDIGRAQAGPKEIGATDHGVRNGSDPVMDEAFHRLRIVQRAAEVASPEKV